MNPTIDYVTLIDIHNGKVLAEGLRAVPGDHTFHAAEAIGVELVDNRTYLTLPVNRNGEPIDTQFHILWTYKAPERPKSTAARFDFAK